MKEQSGGKRLRLVSANGRKQLLGEIFTALMIGLNVWLSIKDLKFSDDRKHRRYLVDLSENEQRLRNNELERNELQECLKEMSLTDEEREEVSQSLTNLMEHGNRLQEENENLHTRLERYENRSLPREMELLKKEGERARLLMRLRFANAQIATLTAVSSASVSQQKFRLKKRLLQTDGTLFGDGETVDAFVCGC